MNADQVSFQRKASIKQERDLAKHCEIWLRKKKKTTNTYAVGSRKENFERSPQNS